MVDRLTVVEVVIIAVVDGVLETVVATTVVVLKLSEAVVELDVLI